MERPLFNFNTSLVFFKAKLLSPLVNKGLRRVTFLGVRVTFFLGVAAFLGLRPLFLGWSKEVSN